MKNKALQMILVMLPAVILGVYVFSYITDLSNIVYMLDVNNKIAEQELKDNNLLEIKDYSGSDTLNYSATMVQDKHKQLKANKGDTICGLLFNTENSAIVFDEEAWTIPPELLFEGYEKVSDDTYKVKIAGRELETKNNSYIGEVVVKDFNKLSVELADDSITEVDSFPYISFKSETEPYMIEVDAEFSKTFNNFEIHYVTNLPNDSIYYSSVGNTFLKNLSKGFAKEFILNSKFVIVFVSYISALLVISHGACIFNTATPQSITSIPYKAII